MSVKKDASGRRYVELEVEVPGTPEEVWRAIATGPGISSWMVPAEFEESDGQPTAVKLNFGPGMEIRTPILAWNPPHSWTNEFSGIVPEAPPLASEWKVEARDGGTCVVRVVQSLFASTDDWDGQLEAGSAAWVAFLRTLKLYLTHFRNLPSAIMKVTHPFAGTEAEAWEALTTALGLKGLTAGETCQAPADSPPFAGTVEYVTQAPYDGLMIIEKPGPGIAAIGTFDCGGSQSMVALHFYLYGEHAAETIAEETPRWEAWFAERFPAPAEAVAAE